jgi:hypothetical protein
MGRRTSLWTSSSSVTSPSRLHFPGVFGRSRIGMPTLGSSRGYLRPTGSGKTSTSLCAVTTGRGYRKKTLGTLLESVGLGGPPRRLVCVFFFFFFFFFFYFFFVSADLFFLMFCSFGSSVVELGLAREDLEDIGNRRPKIQYLH